MGEVIDLREVDLRGVRLAPQDKVWCVPTTLLVEYIRCLVWTEACPPEER